MGGFVSSPTPAPAPAPQPTKPKPKPVIQDIDPSDPAYSKSKRRGRRSTILTSTTGASDQLELAKKTLLGG